MEILSTGEKIKRSRIYKGYTLKDICGDKVSVSKMSCIENGKIKAEDWILEFVADKLDMDIEYLKQDVREQLILNTEILKKSNETKDYEEKLEYNLKFAEEYKYHDISFEFMHLLFSYYIDKNKIDKMQMLTSRYYDSCQKLSNNRSHIIYYMDMARYFYISKEYLQAANYYNNVRSFTGNQRDFKTLSKVTYNEAASYIMLQNYERAYEISVRLKELMDYMENDYDRADAYQMLALLDLRLDKGNFEEYEKKSYEWYKDDSFHKAKALYNYADTMFEMGLKDKAREYMKNGIEIFPKNDIDSLVRFMILNVSALVENEELEMAQDICDEAVDYAINLNDVAFIERTYYYKAIILEKQNNLFSAEMYMNLSLDALIKFGNRQHIYKRYMEMGDMYHKMGNTADSIKYFALAISMEKKI